MNRRDFLEGSLECLLFSKLLSLPFSVERAYGASKSTNTVGQRHLVVADSPLIRTVNNRIQPTHGIPDIPGSVRVMNLASGEVQNHPTPIWAHKYTQHPLFPALALGVAKWTPSAIVIDLKTGKIANKLTALPGEQFVGHGVFDPNGSRAYISASSPEKGRGRIYIYDAQSWVLVDRLEINAYVHELIWSQAGDILFAGGDPKDASFNSGVVGVIRPSTGLITQTFKTASYYHLSQLDDRLVALGGMNSKLETRVGYLDLSTGLEKDIRRSPDFPKVGIESEALSLCPLNKEEFAITFCEAKKLGVWNIRTNRMRLFEFNANTAGVALELGELFVTYGKERPQLYRSALAQLEKPKALKFEKDISFGNGRHLTLMTI